MTKNRIREAVAMADLKHRVEELCQPRHTQGQDEAEAFRQDALKYSDDVAEAHENRRNQAAAMAGLKRRVEELTWERRRRVCVEVEKAESDERAVPRMVLDCITGVCFSWNLCFASLLSVRMFSCVLCSA